MHIQPLDQMNTGRQILKSSKSICISVWDSWFGIFNGQIVLFLLNYLPLIGQQYDLSYWCNGYAFTYIGSWLLKFTKKASHNGLQKMAHCRFMQ